MELWAAIRIRHGRSVSPREGFDPGQNPLGVVDRLVAEGAQRLHLVDLDAADGSGDNRELVLALVRRSGLTVQVGGGVRTPEGAAELLAGGATRVLVGTAAVTAPDLFAEMCDRWPHRLVCCFDYRLEAVDGEHKRREVVVNGRSERGGLTVEEGLARITGLDLAAVVVTDISRDGTGTGPDLAAFKSFLEGNDFPLLAGGGIGSAADIALLGRITTGRHPLAGVVVGTALHWGRLSVAEAESAARGPSG